MLRTVGIVMTALAMVAAFTGCANSDESSTASGQLTAQTSVGAQSSTTAPSASPVSSPAAPGDPACNPDPAVIRNAAATLSPVTLGTATWQWSTPPSGAQPTVNEICAPLSAYLLTIHGATASSPMQVLLFHQGNYVGTAEQNWNSFISADPSRTTPDTVGLKYMIPGSCDACSDGTFYCAQFHWDGKAVQEIGKPPETSAGNETPGSTKC